ncbi:MAG: chorismate synthase [Candidatus Humimicrobiaceae bacterium]
MRFLTSGRSHGKALVGIIDGYPSGVKIDISFINKELARRQKGFGRGGRMDIEKDKADIIAGVNANISTGSPISFIIKNKDWKNWKNKKEGPLLNPRPGHADFPGFLKYRLSSIRDVIERSSARETSARVATGAFAKLFLACLNIGIFSYVRSIGKASFAGSFKVKKDNYKLVEKSPVRCPDKETETKIIEEIKKAKKEGDTLGGSFKVIAKGLPPGIGNFIQWDSRLDSKIGEAFMSIPAIKAVEIGEGFRSGEIKGTEFHDEIHYNKNKGFYRKTNNAGGVEGGMSNGEDIVVGAVMKPIPTTRKGLKTVNISSKQADISLKERSDVCAVPSASIVGEAMLAIVLSDFIQDKFGSDNIREILENMDNYSKYYESI